MTMQRSGRARRGQTTLSGPPSRSPFSRSVILKCARLLTLCAMVIASSGQAQDVRNAPPPPSEDVARLCPLVTEKLAGLVAKAAKGQGTCEVVCRGCGCKGGPGYRKNGSCVGWKNLIKECGPPPHARCEAECEPVEPGCPGRAWIKDLASKAGLSVQFIEGHQRAKAASGAVPSPRSGQSDATVERFVSGGASEDDVQFSCAGKRRCGQMNSCAEARFYLSVCGVKSLDGNHDGIPCNSLCR